jgi:hypothetical protein
MVKPPLGVKRKSEKVLSSQQHFCRVGVAARVGADEILSVPFIGIILPGADR